MAYAAREDLVQRYGESEIAMLEDPSGTGVPDSAVSEAAIKDAEDEVDSYVGMRYSLPLPSVPQPIIRCTCDIARFRLYKDRPTEEIKYRYERTIRWLEQLSLGKVALTFLPVLTPVQIEESFKPATPYAPTGGNQIFNDCLLDKIPRIE